jgi:tetratricopeptide (TPR) repeat protein
MVILALSPTVKNGFTGCDDPDYVTQNTHVNTGLTRQNVVWAFTEMHSNNWHPLTWLSHQLDCTLFGSAAAGHHLTSLLLHVVNTILLYLWLSALTGLPGRSAFVALAFGIHPVHVESVAWVAERKDVLSTFFWMLTLLAYTFYARRPGIARYLAVTAFFVAGLLSKPMLVTVPVLLLMLDWWPLDRKRSRAVLIAEKLPWMALALLSAAVTVLAQKQGGAFITLGQMPLGPRMANVVVSYVRYIGKTVWPVRLAAFYPFPLHGFPAWAVAGSAAALAAATWLAFRERKRRPWLAAGWCWYLLTLVPVIGIVQVGQQSIADRYLYVPMIGLLIAVSWQCGEFCEASPMRTRAAALAAAVALGICGVLSWRQSHVWKDGLTLFTHAIQVTEDNYAAHDDRGVELDRLGRFEEALAEYREALRIMPADYFVDENFSRANFDEGQRLLKQGQLEGAQAAFREALRVRPRNALTHLWLGVALARSGQPAEALKELQDSLQYEPGSVEAYYRLGLVQQTLGARREALDAYDAALRLKPDFGPAHAARAEALYALGRYPEAWDALLAARGAHTEVDPALAAKLEARMKR